MSKSNYATSQLLKVHRSPLFYVGDKFKLLPEITKYFPKEIKNFIEPFTGGGSVFLNVKADEYFLNDIDPYVVKLHEFLIQQAGDPKTFFQKIEEIILAYRLSRSYKEDIVPDDFKVKWKKTYYAHFNRKSFHQLRDDFNSAEETNFFQLYVLLIYGFNRMLRFNSEGKYNLPVGNVDFNNNVIDALKDYFELVKTRAIKWHNLDYTEFLKAIEIDDKDFLYLDPPYLITFSEYNKFWNDEREEELVKLLDGLDNDGMRFAVSNVTHYKGKVNGVFEKWAEKYVSVPIKSNYISYHDNTIKDFKEVLVTNYAA